MELTLQEKSETLLSSRVPSRLIFLILTLLTLAVFKPVLNYDFVNYDDDKYVVKNPYLVKGFSWKGLEWAFTADLLYDSPYVDYWQPVTALSRILDGQLFGLDAAGHHRMNLIFHILNTLLLFSLLHEMTGALGRSAVVAGLFAVHPLQVEAVAWVTARKDLLSTFFGLLALAAYGKAVKRPSLTRRLGVVFLFLLALMSKPMLVSLPFLLLLWDYWPLGRISLNPFVRREWTRALIEKAPLFALSLLYSILPFIGQPRILQYASTAVILSNIPWHYLQYLGNFIDPVRLTIDSVFPDAGLHLWQAAGAGVSLIALTILIVSQAKQRPHLVVGWFWFLFALVPVIGLGRVEDRFMYLPLVGLLVMGTWGIWNFLATRRHRRALAALLAGILFLIFTPRAFTQVHYWKNSFTLFEHVLQLNPNDYVAYNQLCSAWLDEREFEKAKAACSQALKLKPDLTKAHYNLGLALTELGQWDPAIAHYTQALCLQPDYFQALSNLGVVLVKQEKWEEAARQFSAALRVKPDAAEIHRNLGFVLIHLGKREEAKRHFEEAEKLSAA